LSSCCCSKYSSKSSPAYGSMYIQLSLFVVFYKCLVSWYSYILFYALLTYFVHIMFVLKFKLNIYIYIYIILSYRSVLFIHTFAFSLKLAKTLVNHRDQYSLHSKVVHNSRPIFLPRQERFSKTTNNQNGDILDGFIKWNT